MFLDLLSGEFFFATFGEFYIGSDARLQLLQDARQKMGLPESESAGDAIGDPDEPRTAVGRVAARC